MSARGSGLPMRTTAAALVAALAHVGCARHVTLDPQSVATRNANDWTIRSSPSAPIAPLPYRERAEVRGALATAPDSLGVPEGLYAVDPLLSDHRKEMASQASARRSVGIGLTIFGLVFGGLAVWGFQLSQSRLDSSDENDRRAGSQLVVSSTIVGVLSLGEIIAGMVMMLSSSDPTPLQRYYRETYAPAK